MESKKFPALTVLMILAAVIAIAVPLCTLFETGSYLWCAVRLPEVHEEWVEIAVLCIISAGIFFGLPKTKWKLAAAFFVSLVFCYCHVDLLPFVLTGLYFAGILLLGGPVRGISVILLTGCLLSLFKAGNASYLRIAVVLLFLAGAAIKAKQRGISDLNNIFSRQLTKEENLMFSVVFVVFLVQAGRLNGTLDFDSLWYGLRSNHVLAPGEGIYEDLGLLGMVYTYSKGFEVLGLPLTGFRSYGYVLFLNVWLFLAGLFYTGKLTRLAVGKKAACYAVILTALVPGIVNMSVSAKPDIITWVLQLMMLCEFLRLVKEEETSVYRLLSVYLLSLTMKPTAVIFSTALFGMMAVWLLVRAVRRKSFAALFAVRDAKGPVDAVLALLVLVGIWGRTVLLTGLPFTSVFSGVLESVGFTVKYPFPAKGLPQNYQDRSAVLVLLDRVYHMLLSPVGKDMSHVLIAWGGSMFFVLLVVLLVSALQKLWKQREKGVGENEESAVFSALLTVFLPYLLTNLVSLSLLYQVDGNYFMTLYSLLILLFCLALSGTDGKRIRKAATVIMVPVLLFQFVVMTTTNWASYMGFTPFRLNRGSYDHIGENREYFESGRRAGETWNILSEDPQAKVIAFADHPLSLRLPAVTQSFEDTFDSWGNAEVVRNADTYLEYLRFQGTDYIYVDPDYFAGDTHQRAKKILDGLMERGILVKVTGDYAELYRVDLSSGK